MPRIKLGPGMQAMEITPVSGGPTYAVVAGEVIDVTNRMEYARVANTPGVVLLDDSFAPAEDYKPSPGVGQDGKQRQARK